MKGKNYWTVERPTKFVHRDQEHHEHFEQVRADSWFLDGGTLIFYNGPELTIRSQVIGFAQGQWLTWFWDEDSLELHAFQPEPISDLLSSDRSQAGRPILCLECGGKKSDFKHLEDEEVL